MLPIRLGMANGDGDQDMLVYAFTKRGRIECTELQNRGPSTGKNIPCLSRTILAISTQTCFSTSGAGKENP